MIVARAGGLLSLIIPNKKNAWTAWQAGREKFTPRLSVLLIQIGIQ
jgi:hypothetical protein